MTFLWTFLKECVFSPLSSFCCSKSPKSENNGIVLVVAAVPGERERENDARSFCSLCSLARFCSIFRLLKYLLFRHFPAFITLTRVNSAPCNILRTSRPPLLLSTLSCLPLYHFYPSLVFPPLIFSSLSWYIRVSFKYRISACSPLSSSHFSVSIIPESFHS